MLPLRNSESRIVKIIFGALLCFFLYIVVFLIAKTYLADKYYNRGLNKEAYGYWIEAISLYEKALQFDSKNVDYYSQLASLYFFRARFPLDRDKFLLKAKDTILKGIKLCPKNGDLWLSLGMLREIWGQTPGFNAQEVIVSQLKISGSDKCQVLTPQMFYKKAISLDPNNAFYHTVLAAYYLKKGMEDEGISQVKKAISCYDKKSHIYSYFKKMKVDEKIIKKIKAAS